MPRLRRGNALLPEQGFWMVLADTSIWIDHLRSPVPELVSLIGDGRVLVHRFVVGELALGSLARRDELLQALSQMPPIPPIAEADLLDFITEKALFGTGLGFVDANLLASVAAWPGARLWTRDRRLREQAGKLSLAHSG